LIKVFFGLSFVFAKFSFLLIDRSGRITFEEFRRTIKALKIGIDNNDEIKHLFEQFDTTKNGQIDLYEFLKQLRPPMNERRQKATLNLFNSMDFNKDGKLTIFDLKVFISFFSLINYIFFSSLRSNILLNLHL
jgi:Ca2+-binding EF-hand superfamily protein